MSAQGEARDMCRRATGPFVDLLIIKPFHCTGAQLACREYPPHCNRWDQIRLSREYGAGFFFQHGSN